MQMRCLSLSLRNSVLGFEGRRSLIGAIQLFCFGPSNVTRVQNSTECVSGAKHLGMEDMLFFFETEEGDWVPFLKALGNAYGKTCVGHWNLLKETEYSTSAGTSPQERGPGLCDQKCHGKSEHCSQSDTFFCSSGPVIHLQGLRLSDLFELVAQNAHTSPGQCIFCP